VACWSPSAVTLLRARATRAGGMTDKVTVITGASRGIDGGQIAGH
jgi:hypothetical protein